MYAESCVRERVEFIYVQQRKHRSISQKPRLMDLFIQLEKSFCLYVYIKPTEKTRILFDFHYDGGYKSFIGGGVKNTKLLSPLRILPLSLISLFYSAKKKIIHAFNSSEKRKIMMMKILFLRIYINFFFASHSLTLSRLKACHATLKQ